MRPPAPGSPEEKTRFCELQARLGQQYVRFRDDPRQPYTAVIVPSASLDARELAKIEGVEHYEERALFNLMLLRRPRLQVVFVTSRRMSPAVIDYYLHQMRGVPSNHARGRLTLLDCDDGSHRALTEKILERPRLVERIRAAILDQNMAHLSTFNSTPLERTLSVQLGIPLFGCDPDLVGLGSKSGSRRVMREAGISIPAGRENLRTEQELVDGIADVWEEKPDLSRIVVKLDDGFSGEGNAVLHLEPLENVAPGSASARERRSAISSALQSLRIEAPGLHWETYLEQFVGMGGICEGWIEAEEKTSPSAQLRISPLGAVQTVSTHDQVLGGPSGQVFLGATFPADPRYRLKIQDLGVRVGEILSREGAIGRFGVDFVVTKSERGVEIYGLEINLRQGGTTHPFNTLKSLTDGEYDESEGIFRTAQGQARAYFATDNLKSPRYRGILPVDLIDALVVNGFHFRADETGVVFHLIGCLSEFGKLGCTAVAPSVPEAKALYQETVQVMDDLATNWRSLECAGAVAQNIE